jgi:ABC-type phosphate transport system permease subunit
MQQSRLMSNVGRAAGESAAIATFLKMQQRLNASLNEVVFLSAEFYKISSEKNHGFWCGSVN